MDRPSDITRCKSDPDLWQLLTESQAVADIPHDIQRQAQDAMFLRPVRDRLAAATRDLSAWLHDRADVMGDLGDDVPVTDEERDWFDALERYKTMSIALTASLDIVRRRYRLPVEAQS